jgi:hypothetical protein
MSNPFKEDDEYIDSIENDLFPNIENNPNILDVESQVFDLGDVIKFLESQAMQYAYLDNYDILVLPESSKPIIIMNQREFDALHEKVCGTRP